MMGVKRKGVKECSLCGSKENLKQLTPNRFMCLDCITMIKNVK